MASPMSLATPHSSDTVTQRRGVLEVCDVEAPRLPMCGGNVHGSVLRGAQVQVYHRCDACERDPARVIGSRTTTPWAWTVNVSPHTLRTTYNFHDDRITIYGDIEGAIDNVREIALIVTRMNNIIDYFHCIVTPNKLTKTEAWCQKYLHGIASHTPSITYADAMMNLYLFIWQYQDCVVKCNGLDISLLLPYMSVKDMNFPSWSERVGTYYYTAAKLFKYHAARYNMFVNPCAVSNHICYRAHPYPKLHTPTQRAKYEHGYHCAMSDAFELFMYDVTTNQRY